MRAVELELDRVPTVLGHGPNTTQWTVEQEYVYALLIHQLNTGNMSPAELDWAFAQIRGWSRRLSLDAQARSMEGFIVDVSGKTGLVRPAGNDSGLMLRYLDTTPLSRAARPRDRRAAPRGDARPCVGAVAQPAARLDPREAASGAGAQSQQQHAPRSAQRLRRHRARAHRPGADLARARVVPDARHGARRSRRPRTGRRADRGLHDRRRRAAEAPRARRARLDRRVAVVVHRSDVAREGPQHRWPPHRRDRRRRRQRWCSARSSRCASPTSRNGCSASCGA